MSGTTPSGSAPMTFEASSLPLGITLSGAQLRGTPTQPGRIAEESTTFSLVMGAGSPSPM